MTKLDPSAYQTAWDQIPWHLNGTLSAEEAAVVEAHIASFPEFAEEVARQQRVSDVLTQFEAPVPNQDLALDAISSRLTAEAQAPARSAPSGGTIRWIIDIVTGRGGISPVRLALGGAVAATALFVVMTTQTPEPRFETLTSPTVPVNGVEIRLRYEAGADLQAVKTLMADAGATGIEGPSDTGLIRGLVSAEMADALVQQLRADPRIIFVTRDR